ncbi:hypothetical protein P4O66_011541 [Electrophorus voltai]|uniref:Synaptotagmin-like protein 1 n=1 Tax=Electrophorus voltai TaxID=2609070 RepID=A0AAD8Z5V1_9TELE|nr:hypothetical protein P4O66_011541 [Electrophorus voltai]
MKSSKDATIFIDLSFLSAEEEGIIRQVLLRDESLKRLEIGRVRRLRNSVLDRKELKVLTGEWFEEIRAKRHGRQPDISAVVRSSIRWKKTAETQLAQSPAKNVHFENPSQKPFKKPTEKPFILRSLANFNNPILGTADLGTKPRDEPKCTTPPVLSTHLEPVLEQKSNSAVATNTSTNAVTPEPRPKMSLPLAEHKTKPFEENLVKISPEANKIGSTEVKTRHKLTDGCTPVETLEIISFSEPQDTSSQDQACHLGRAVETSSTEPKVEDDNIMSSRKCAEIEVKHKQNHTKHMFVMKKDSPAFEEEVLISQSINWDPKRDHELLAVSLEKQENSDELPTVSSAEMMKKQVSPSNTAQKIQDKRHEIEKDEIPVANFRMSSPTRMDVLSVDLNMEENASITEDQTEALNDLNTPKGAILNQKRSADINRDILTEVVVKDAVPGRKGDFDVELRDSVSADKKTESKQTNQIKTSQVLCYREQSHTFSEVADVMSTSKEDSRRESDILASVYERALRTKLPMSKYTSTQNPKQEKTEIGIPTIVVMPSESEDPTQIESMANGSPEPDASVKVAIPVAPSFIADVWEDEGVDSDNDSSSVSSYGSDHSGRRPISASTISVTERSGSLLSVYSDAGDFGNVTVQGSVEFALMYSPLGELVIMVEQCQDLAIANPRKQRTDPYVKTYLYPDKRSKRKTSIKKRTVNPVYVESLRYKVKREELHAKTLNLSVWHNDSRGRNAFLGQVEISLKAWDWKHETLTWYNLQPKSKDNQESPESCGLLSISLKYVPPESTGGYKLRTGEIHIWLREARCLRSLKTQGVDSFVKCYMLPDTSKKSRQKTQVVKKTQDPVYNHAMVYDGFRSGEVREACCELTVWDNNRFSNQFLGGVRLSLGTGQSYGKKVDWMDSANEEVDIWERMLASPNSWVEAELSLRCSMAPRK